MNKCIVCNKSIIENVEDLLGIYKVCSNCYNKYSIIKKREIINGVEHLFLYKYQGIVKEILHRYKIGKDIALKYALIDRCRHTLRVKYKGYTFVCAPSNKKNINEREFNHIYEIARLLSMRVICPFKKIKSWKQSEKNYEERKKVAKVIKLDKTQLFGFRKIVLIDDIYTTGSTINAMIRQIDNKVDIKVLCLCKNCQ